MLAAVLILAICAAVDWIIYNIFGNYRRRAGVSWHIKMDVCAVLISNLLISMLRSVETVRISFIISVVSLLANGGINYTLILDISDFWRWESGVQRSEH